MQSVFVLATIISVVGISANVSKSADYWIKTYSGTDWDHANAVQQTSDSGYIVAGATRSFGAGEIDIWLIKLDVKGTVQWEKTYGGTSVDQAYSVQQTSDNGYIVAGHTASFGAGNLDCWLLKLDGNGAVQWQKTYGGTSYETAYSVQETSDNGYIVAGDTGGTYDQNVWLLKLDSSGTIQWQKIYGVTSQPDGARSVQQTSDNGYIVAATTWSFASTLFDIWLLKLDSSGAVQWQKTYGLIDERVASVQQTNDNGYIVAATTSSSGISNCWLLKLDSNGTVQWQKTYGGTGYDYAGSAQQTNDNGYIVTGYTNGASNEDIWLLKLDSSGAVQWQKTYLGAEDEHPRSVQQTSDNGYIMAGHTWSFEEGNDEIWLLKVDNSGDVSECDIVATSNTQVTETMAIVTNTSVTPINSSAIMNDTSAPIANSSGVATIICPAPDFDGDGIPREEDNCPNIPNGPFLGTCYSWSGMATGTTCVSDTDCGGLPNSCSMNQEDTSPPQGNGIGDACDCESDFDCNGAVDANDVTAFVGDFGRNIFCCPCTNLDQCNGDSNCDGNVDALDVNKFLEDFGRSQYYNPCPACEVGDWCVYP